MKVLVGIDIHGEPQKLLDALRCWTERVDARFDLAHASSYSADSIGRDASPAMLWRLNHLDELRGREIKRLEELARILPEARRGQVRLLDGRALDVLPEASAEYDMVVVGTHGRTGLSHALLGSVAERVVRAARSPVLVLHLAETRAKLPARPRVVLPCQWPNAGPEGLIETRRLLGDEAELHLLHVLSLPDTPVDPLPAELNKAVSNHRNTVVGGLRQLANDQGWPDAQVHLLTSEGGNVGTEIAAFAEQQRADLVVLPTQGRTGLARLRLGSVAERVVRLGPCPVLVTRFQQE